MSRDSHVASTTRSESFLCTRRCVTRCKQKLKGAESFLCTRWWVTRDRYDMQKLQGAERFLCTQRCVTREDMMISTIAVHEACALNLSQCYRRTCNACICSRRNLHAELCVRGCCILANNWQAKLQACTRLLLANDCMYNVCAHF